MKSTKYIVGGEKGECGDRARGGGEDKGGGEGLRRTETDVERKRAREIQEKGSRQNGGEVDMSVQVTFHAP